MLAAYTGPVLDLSNSAEWIGMVPVPGGLPGGCSGGMHQVDPGHAPVARPGNKYSGAGFLVATMGGCGRGYILSGTVPDLMAFLGLQRSMVEYMIKPDLPGYYNFTYSAFSLGSYSASNLPFFVISNWLKKPFPKSFVFLISIPLFSELFILIIFLSLLKASSTFFVFNFSLAMLLRTIEVFESDTIGFFPIRSPLGR